MFILFSNNIYLPLLPSLIVEEGVCTSHPVGILLHIIHIYFRVYIIKVLWSILPAILAEVETMGFLKRIHKLRENPTGYGMPIVPSCLLSLELL